MGELMFEPGEYLAGGLIRVDGLLGSGGMAQVLRGWDTRLQRKVAIKTLLPGPGSDRATVERFRREAEAMAGFTHPHVVAVHQSGVEPRPGGPSVPYFVMELVDGQSLEDRLRNRGTLPVQEAVRIADQVLNALTASHALGLVHRDIKPGNILLTENGTAKVADFGIARSVVSEATALTGTGFTIGTPAYMSPEQIEGRPDIDGRSDLYAVGLLLFEMLTGRQPFGANRLVVGHHHLHQRPPTLTEAGLPGLPGLEVVLDRALAKRREDRYQNAREMRVALRPADGWTGSNGSTKRLPSQPYAAAPWPLRTYRKTVTTARAAVTAGSRARSRFKARAASRAARRPAPTPRMARWRKARNLRIGVVFATPPVAWYLSMFLSLGDSDPWPLLGIAGWSLAAVVLSLPVRRLWSVRLPLRTGLAWCALIFNAAGLLSTLQTAGDAYADTCKPDSSSFCLWAQHSDLLR
ncbi:serine/threonine-protein kinase [Streptomyces sp. NPDC058401]|uniref:serine/threonine-protein kinase n=1 Tax=Streptomyces sp. NPDC058401 TaxID=3346480 RepID=UPI0036598D15